MSVHVWAIPRYQPDVNFQEEAYLLLLQSRKNQIIMIDYESIWEM